MRKYGGLPRCNPMIAHSLKSGKHYFDSGDYALQQQLGHPGALPRACLRAQAWGRAGRMAALPVLSAAPSPGCHLGMATLATASSNLASGISFGWAPPGGCARAVRQQRLTAGEVVRVF